MALLMQATNMKSHFAMTALLPNLHQASEQMLSSLFCKGVAVSDV